MTGYICHECGLKYGTRKPDGMHTSIYTKCEWCAQEGYHLPSRHYGLTNKENE